MSPLPPDLSQRYPLLPSSPAALVHYDAVPLFCERLHSIERSGVANANCSPYEFSITEPHHVYIIKTTRRKLCGFA